MVGNVCGLWLVFIGVFGWGVLLKCWVVFWCFFEIDCFRVSGVGRLW